MMNIWRNGTWQRADIQARLNLIPYDGNPEIKEANGAKYLYMRK